MINKDIYKSFENFNVFEQINFIDNFYNNIDIEKTKEKDLENLLEGAYKKMVAHKEYKNTPIVHSKDGKIVKVYPKK